MLKVRPLTKVKGEVSESLSVLLQALFSMEKQEESTVERDLRGLPGTSSILHEAGFDHGEETWVTCFAS